MFYGISGTGKTVAALQLCKMLGFRNVQYFESAENWISVINHPTLYSWAREAVTVNQFSELVQFEKTYRLIASRYGDYADVDCVIFDEASTMARRDQDFVLDRSVANNPEKYQDNPDSADWPIYNASNNRFRRSVARFSEIPGLSIILVAHEQDRKLKSGLYQVQPAFAPELGPELRGPLHLVARFTNDIKMVDQAPVYDRIAQCWPTKAVIAKSRIGDLGYKMSVMDMLATIKAWYANGSAPVAAAPMIPVDDQFVIDPDEH